MNQVALHEDEMMMNLPASGVMPKKTIKKIVPTLLERIDDHQPDNRTSKPPSPYDNEYFPPHAQQSRQSEMTYSFTENQIRKTDNTTKI